MIFAALYLMAGLANCLQFMARGAFSSRWEFLFYFLLWPAQLGFFLVVGLHALTGGVLDRIFNR